MDRRAKLREAEKELEIVILPTKPEKVAPAQWQRSASAPETIEEDPVPSGKTLNEEGSSTTVPPGKTFQ